MANTFLDVVLTVTLETASPLLSTLLWFIETISLTDFLAGAMTLDLAAMDSVLDNRRRCGGFEGFSGRIKVAEEEEEEDVMEE